MADYSSNYDERLDRMAKEFFEKEFFHKCTDGEKKAIREIKAARERLRRVDKFLWELR